jgi:hypothetical protein
MQQGVITQEEYEQLLAMEEKAGAMEAELRGEVVKVEEEEESVVADSVRRMSSWFLSGGEEPSAEVGSGEGTIAEGEEGLEDQGTETAESPTAEPSTVVALEATASCEALEATAPCEALEATAPCEAMLVEQESVGAAPVATPTVQGGEEEPAPNLEEANAVRETPTEPAAELLSEPAAELLSEPAAELASESAPAPASEPAVMCAAPSAEIVVADSAEQDAARANSPAKKKTGEHEDMEVEQGLEAAEIEGAMVAKSDLNRSLEHAKSGFLQKCGPKGPDDFRRRFFRLNLETKELVCTIDNPATKVEGDEMAESTAESTPPVRIKGMQRVQKGEMITKEKARGAKLIIPLRGSLVRVRPAKSLFHEFEILEACIVSTKGLTERESPSNKQGRLHVLRADSERELVDWMVLLEKGTQQNSQQATQSPASSHTSPNKTEIPDLLSPTGSSGGSPRSKAKTEIEEEAVAAVEAGGDPSTLQAARRPSAHSE